VNSPPSAEFKSSPAEGLKSLALAYAYWTGKITDISFQTCLTIVAANWALYQKPGEIVAHSWSLASLSVALLAVLVSLLGAGQMARLHFKRFYDAQTNPKQWEADWKVAEETPSQWPFTDDIVLTGRVFSALKIALPLISGVCFLVSAWSG
jgi:hypothetical protein